MNSLQWSFPVSLFASATTNQGVINDIGEKHLMELVVTIDKCNEQSFGVTKIAVKMHRKRRKEFPGE